MAYNLDFKELNSEFAQFNAPIVLSGVFNIKIKGIRGDVGEFSHVIGSSLIAGGFYFRGNANNEFSIYDDPGIINTFILPENVNLNDDYILEIYRDISNDIRIKLNEVLSPTVVSNTSNYSVKYLARCENLATGYFNNLVKSPLIIDNNGVIETFTFPEGPPSTTTTGSLGTVLTLNSTGVIADMWVFVPDAVTAPTPRMAMGMAKGMPFGR